MSNVLYYYAKINENNVCYGFETLAKKFKEEELPSNLVYLHDCNESLIYKKWQGKDKGWTMESYEPDTDFELLERIDGLEQENRQLTNQVSSLESTLQDVNSTNETLVQSIAELTSIIATLQTP